MDTSALSPMRVNFWRHAQAVGLLPLLVDAELDAHAYVVVQLLGRLMHSDSDDSGSSHWYVTLPEIVDATLLSESTVRRALNSLIKHGFLRKTYQPHKGNVAGRKAADGIGYFHCVYWTTPIWCEILTTIDKDYAPTIAKAKAAMKAGPAAVEPKPLPEPKPKPKTFTLDDDDEQADNEQPDDVQVDDNLPPDVRRVYNQLEYHLGDYPSMQLQNSEVVMRPTIDAFLACADAATVCTALAYKLTPEMVKRLSAFERLGGYLAPCASGWVADSLKETCRVLISLVLSEQFRGAISPNPDH